LSYNSWEQKSKTTRSAVFGQSDEIKPDPTRCFKDGWKDGLDNPYDQRTHEFCGGNLPDSQNQYMQGFIAGCKAADNSQEVCEESIE
jgi:hypothetical protein